MYPSNTPAAHHYQPTLSSKRLLILPTYFLIHFIFPLLIYSGGPPRRPDGQLNTVPHYRVEVIVPTHSLILS